MIKKITFETKIRKMKLVKISDDPLVFDEILIEDESKRLPRRNSYSKSTS